MSFKSENCSMSIVEGENARPQSGRLLMSPFEVRIEDVSGKASIIVTANVAEGWRPTGNHYGFYGFAREKYLEDGLITVRAWVTASPAQSNRAQNGFPLDLQSMGSSPSRALAFRLFNGRLSLGAALSTVINSRRSDGSPGYYREAVLLAQHAAVSYWLRFYAALNDEHPDMPEMLEPDFPASDEAGLAQVTDIRELRASSIEDRLSRASQALDSLEERAGALVREFQAQPSGGSAASHGNGAGSAALSEKTAQDLREQWFKEFERQAQAAMEKLREEVTNSGRAFEESKQQLASLAEAKLASLNQAATVAAGGLEAAVKQLREEVGNSGRAFEESKQQLASLAEAKLASLNQAATDAAGSLEAAMAKLREEVGNSGRAIAESKRELAGLAEAKIALLNQVASDAVASVEAEQKRFRGPFEISPKGLGDVSTRRSPNQPPTVDDPGNAAKRRGVVAMLSLAAGLFLIVTVAPFGVYLSTPPPVQMHLQSEMPPDFADQSPYWSAKRRAKEEETARAYWRAAASGLQMRYTFGSVLPADPLPEFQVDLQYAPTGGEGAATETRTRYWEKLRAYWGKRRFWVASQPVNETWGEHLRRVWEQIEAKLG